MAATSSTTQRLEAFSDGVIAIAITLLVLQIDVPNARQGSLFDALLDLWPSYLAFVLSFVVIGIMWVSHHSMFERIANVDRRLLFLNLLLLMGIAFLPFPTALLARYLQQGGENAEFAAAAYSATMMLIGLFFMAMWHHLYRNPGLLVAGIGAERARTAMVRSVVGPIVYGVTIGLAFLSPEACLAVYALIALYFAGGPSSRVATPDQAPAAEAAPVDEEA
ncbi:MAG TPA: TMEM175 family protein [Acidimicrobiia bacterium]